MATSTSAPMQSLDSESFNPYRNDGKLYGFVCIVTGSTYPIGRAIVLELACERASKTNLSTK